MDQTGPADRDPSPDHHRQRLADAVERYHRPLIAYAQSLTGDFDGARDAAQDVLLRLCQQPAERFASEIEPRLGAWLFTVCRNRVIDRFRMESRMTHADPTTLDHAGQARLTPADCASHHDQQDHLLRLVEHLPGNQREVVRLRFDGGLCYREIAEVTGHSVSHVGVLLHEAIKQLRQQLTQLNAVNG